MEEDLEAPSKIITEHDITVEIPHEISPDKPQQISLKLAALDNLQSKYAKVLANRFEMEVNKLLRE